VAKFKALSLKQPWATLLVHGVKTIEVRRWATTFRGALLIHASSVPDEREEVWRRVPAELVEEARRLNGGVVGRGELAGCLRYANLMQFVRDTNLHLNDPEWFKPPALYGFSFAQLTTLPFRVCSGNLRIFNLELD